MNSRKRFLALAAGGFAPAQLGVRAASSAQFEYKYHHQLPVDSPMHVRLVQLWNEVKRATNGRLIVRIFPNNELGSDAAIVTQLRAGAVQFASLASQSATGLIPPVAIIGMGFAFRSEAAAIAGIDGKLGEALRREMEAKGILAIAVPTFELGFKQLTISARAVATPNDLSGLKIRVAPARITVDLFRTLGATPTPVDFAQTYTSLQTHLVDGTESPLSVIDVSRFFEVQRFLSLTNHSWGGYWVVANPEAWRALPDDIRRIVNPLLLKYIALERRDIVIQNGTYLDKLVRQGMVKNETDADAFRTRLAPYYARWKAEFGNTLWGLVEEYSGGKLG